MKTGASGFLFKYYFNQKYWFEKVSGRGMGSVLEFVGLSKEYRRFGRTTRLALDALSLTVERGEIFGFLGANGAGKTTAIHLAMGFMRATAGSGTMLGHPFGHVPTRRRVGFLGENFALYPRRADELLHFYGALNGIRNPQLRQRVQDVLRSVDMEDRCRENVKSISRGMQQRIGLAQALLNEPDLLILDEPTSALDPFARIAIRELLLQLRNAGKSVFLSSHLLSEVEQVCDRVAILREGKLVRVSTLTGLLEDTHRFTIRARGVNGLFPAIPQTDGCIELTVPSNEQRKTIEQIWAAGGEVLSVGHACRTLEDIFIDLARPGDSENLAS